MFSLRPCSLGLLYTAQVRVWSSETHCACLQPPRSPPPGNLLPDAGHLAPHTHATPQTVQGTDLMRFAAAGDATLLIGGDLIVTVCQVRFEVA